MYILALFFLIMLYILAFFLLIWCCKISAIFCVLCQMKFTLVTKHTDDKPKPHQLIRVTGRSGEEVVVRDQLASHWEDLLLLLQFQPPSSAQDMIQHIGESCRGDVQEACREVLLKWLSGDPPSHCKPVTWRTLIGVIRKLDNRSLAGDLEKELLP